MKYEGKRLGGDILILLGKAFLNDVTEYGAHKRLCIDANFANEGKLKN
jgi:hypothetical protein